jgi:hypothetical protein
MKSRYSKKMKVTPDKIARLYKMVPYHALPCSLEIFTIKGKEANIDDFGHGEAEGHEDYCCQGWYFHTKPVPEDDVLVKYGISPAEYKEICEALESELAVGDCGWCS